MTQPRLLSIIESPTHPELSDVYQRLKLKHWQVNSMRKAISQVKKQPPDFIVAEFFYGYGNNYAGITNPNPDNPIFSLFVPAHGKASVRRCSTSTASTDNEVRGQAQTSPKGVSGSGWLCVAVFDKGLPLPANRALIQPDPEALKVGLSGFGLVLSAIWMYYCTHCSAIRRKRA